MDKRVDEQEDVSRARANRLIEDEVDGQLPELIADYQPTASAVALSREEVAAGEVTSVDNDDEDENVVV
jgi:hypothetical protein